jgi:hypothetical protein
MAYVTTLTLLAYEDMSYKAFFNMCSKTKSPIFSWNYLHSMEKEQLNLECLMEKRAIIYLYFSNI